MHPATVVPGLSCTDVPVMQLVALVAWVLDALDAYPRAMSDPVTLASHCQVFSDAWQKWTGTLTASSKV